MQDYILQNLCGAGYQKIATLLATLSFSGTQVSKSSFIGMKRLSVKGLYNSKEYMHEKIKATILDALYDKNIPSGIAMDLYWKWENGELVKEIDQIGRTVSFDMAWQKWGSGYRYDSTSSRAIMIERENKKS